MESAVPPMSESSIADKVGPKIIAGGLNLKKHSNSEIKSTSVHTNNVPNHTNLRNPSTKQRPMPITSPRAVYRTFQHITGCKSLSDWSIDRQLIHFDNINPIKGDFAQPPGSTMGFERVDLKCEEMESFIMAVMYWDGYFSCHSVEHNTISCNLLRITLLEELLFMCYGLERLEAEQILYALNTGDNHAIYVKLNERFVKRPLLATRSSPCTTNETQLSSLLTTDLSQSRNCTDNENVIVSESWESGSAVSNKISGAKTKQNPWGLQCLRNHNVYTELKESFISCITRVWQDYNKQRATVPPYQRDPDDRGSRCGYGFIYGSEEHVIDMLTYILNLFIPMTKLDDDLLIRLFCEMRGVNIHVYSYANAVTDKLVRIHQYMPALINPHVKSPMYLVYHHHYFELLEPVIRPKHTIIFPIQSLLCANLGVPTPKGDRISNNCANIQYYSASRPRCPMFPSKCSSPPGPSQDELVPQAESPVSNCLTNNVVECASNDIGHNKSEPTGSILRPDLSPSKTLESPEASSSPVTFWELKWDCRWAVTVQSIAEIRSVILAGIATPHLKTPDLSSDITGSIIGTFYSVTDKIIGDSKQTMFSQLADMIGMAKVPLKETHVLQKRHVITDYLTSDDPNERPTVLNRIVTSFTCRSSPSLTSTKNIKKWCNLPLVDYCSTLKHLLKWTMFSSNLTNSKHLAEMIGGHFVAVGLGTRDDSGLVDSQNVWCYRLSESITDYPCKSGEFQHYEGKTDRQPRYVLCNEATDILHHSPNVSPAYESPLTIHVTPQHLSLYEYQHGNYDDNLETSLVSPLHGGSQSFERTRLITNRSVRAWLLQRVFGLFPEKPSVPNINLIDTACINYKTGFDRTAIQLLKKANQQKTQALDGERHNDNHITDNSSSSSSSSSSSISSDSNNSDTCRGSIDNVESIAEQASITESLFDLMLIDNTRIYTIDLCEINVVNGPPLTGTNIPSRINIWQAHFAHCANVRNRRASEGSLFGGAETAESADTIILNIKVPFESFALVIDSPQSHIQLNPASLDNCRSGNGANMGATNLQRYLQSQESAGKTVNINDLTTRRDLLKHVMDDSSDAFNWIPSNPCSSSGKLSKTDHILGFKPAGSAAPLTAVVTMPDVDNVERKLYVLVSDTQTDLICNNDTNGTSARKSITLVNAEKVANKLKSSYSHLMLSHLTQSKTNK